METAQDAPTLSGRVLDGRYKLERVIARGGMATVYLASDTRLDRAVAVKIMHRALADDPEFVARFGREARAAASVSTPEVVAVHDQGTDPETGLAYLVMEHIPGENLRQLLNERGALSPARAVSVMEPVLRALAAAHAAGIVHRDVKPENVLLADDGRVKVTDFGLARAVETSSVTQTTGLLIGTVAYLAPEQVESGSADARTDVYAAGIMLWELLTGHPPYDGEKPLSVAYRHVHEDVPPPSTAAPGVPAALDELVVRATRRNPDERPADAGAFLADLRAVGSNLPQDTAVSHPTLVVPRQVPPAAAKTARERKSRRGVVLVALLALLALVGGYVLASSLRYTHAPNVLRLTLAEASQALHKDGLHLRQGADRFSETVQAGRVLTQTPGPNGKVAKGGTVTVYLSKGPDRRTVPSVVNDDISAATAALQAQGLQVAAQPRDVYSDTVAKGLVVGTDPAVGTPLKPGTSVTLLVSRGKQPIPVPNVTGMKQDKASSELTKLGFHVTVQHVFSDTVQPGFVVGQSPSSGSADKGSTVVLSVSKGPQMVTVPDVRGEPAAQGRHDLEARGFVVEEHDLSGGPGNVIQTDPKPGQKAPHGSTVIMYVF